MHRTTILAAALLAVLAAALGGCAEDDGSSGGLVSAEDPADGASGGSEGHGNASPAAPGARHIPVEARSFAFEPDEITVAPGEEVAIVITSDDGAHDFTLDDLDAHIPADGGETGYGGFQAGDPGRYTYYCSVEGHREAGMEGVLVVAS